MAFSHTIGGTTFTEASFEGNAYADEDTGFPKALEKMVEHVANAYRGTSTTSNAVGTGSKTWTVTNSNSQIPAFAVGMPVRVSRTSAPTTTYLQGEITAFTASTGSTTVNVSSSVGSGTHTDWTITIGGHQTTASASPLGLAAGGTGATSAAAARTSIGVGTGDSPAFAGLTTTGDVGIGGSPTAGVLHTIGTGNQAVRFECTDDNHVRLELDADRAADNVLTTFDGLWDGTTVTRIQTLAGSNDESDANLTFHTKGNSDGAPVERMRIDDSGKVGIGTTTPKNLLHLRGTGTSGQSTAAMILENGSSGTAGLDITGTAGASRLRFLYGGGPSTGTNTLTEGISMVLEGASAGDVGIGTAAPKRHLHINSSGASTTKIQITNASTGAASDGDGFQLGISNDGTANIEQRENLDLSFTTNNTERMRIDSGGDVNLATGNLVISLGKGISFAATSDATGMTSELLDDYEIGLFTPAIRGAGTAGTYELATAIGRYVKIGDSVTVNASITLASSVTGGGSGSLQITGLPLTSYGMPVAGAIACGGVDLASNTISVTVNVASSQTRCDIYETSHNAAIVVTPISAVSANTVIRFSATFTVA